MVTMAQSATQTYRKLAQHACSHGLHAFTHTLSSTQLQTTWCEVPADCTHSLTHFHQHSCKPRGAKCQLSYYFSVYAGSFHVSVIHRTLTWTTRSLSCVRDHFCACVYTGGLAHRHRVSTTFLTRKKRSQICSCAPDADVVRTSGLWISSPTLYQLSHPVSRIVLPADLRCMAPYSVATMYDGTLSCTVITMPDGILRKSVFPRSNSGMTNETRSPMSKFSTWIRFLLYFRKTYYSLPSSFNFIFHKFLQSTVGCVLSSES